MLLANVSSASAMWAANAATVSPSADAGDKRVHLTPANLSSHLHRSIEAETTGRVLKAIFSDEKHFVVHEPVPFAVFGDEGAANHCRITRRHGVRGMELFVHGRSALVKDAGAYFARQAVEDAWAEYEEQLRSLGVGTARAVRTLLWDTRYSLLTIALAGFGRAASEVGAVMIVGGNIDGVTRVMTTAIALETSKGDLPLALALGLVLLGVVALINLAVGLTQRRPGTVVGGLA